MTTKFIGKLITRDHGTLYLDARHKLVPSSELFGLATYDTAEDAIDMVDTALEYMGVAEEAMLDGTTVTCDEVEVLYWFVRADGNRFLGRTELRGPLGWVDVSRASCFDTEFAAMRAARVTISAGTHYDVIAHVRP